MIDENYLGLYFQEDRRQHKKAYFKKDKLYIDGNEFIHQPNITQETANRDSQQLCQYATRGARPQEKVSGSFNGRRNEHTSGYERHNQRR